MALVFSRLGQEIMLHVTVKVRNSNICFFMFLRWTDIQTYELSSVVWSD